MKDLQKLIKQLQTIDMVIDSDTGNETDDQFAVAYALMCQDRFNIHSLISSPFLHYRVLTAAEGEYFSHLEQKQILHFFPESNIPLWRGSNKFLDSRDLNKSHTIPECVTKILELSKDYTKEKPLFYVCIATLTNLAIAIKEDPSLVERVVLVWLGGNGYNQPVSEFNQLQDISASQIVLNSSMKKLLFPCKDVAERLNASLQEMKENLPQYGIGSFLFNRFLRHLTWSYGENSSSEITLSLYDVLPFAFLNNPEYVDMDLCQCLELKKDPPRYESALPDVALIAKTFNKKAIFQDFYNRIKRQNELPPPDFLTY